MTITEYLGNDTCKFEIDGQSIELSLDQLEMAADMIYEYEEKQEIQELFISADKINDYRIDSDQSSMIF